MLQCQPLPLPTTSITPSGHFYHSNSTKKSHYHLFAYSSPDTFSVPPWLSSKTINAFWSQFLLTFFSLGTASYVIWLRWKNLFVTAYSLPVDPISTLHSNLFSQLATINCIDPNVMTTTTKSPSAPLPFFYVDQDVHCPYPLALHQLHHLLHANFLSHLHCLGQGPPWQWHVNWHEHLLPLLHSLPLQLLSPISLKQPQPSKLHCLESTGQPCYCLPMLQPQHLSSPFKQQ